MVHEIFSWPHGKDSDCLMSIAGPQDFLVVSMVDTVLLIQLGCGGSTRISCGLIASIAIIQ